MKKAKAKKTDFFFLSLTQIVYKQSLNIKTQTGKRKMTKNVCHVKTKRKKANVAMLI